MNPLWAVLAYVIYRVLFTNPGRRPLDEDMTDEH